MRYDPDRHHRRSIRLQGYDYTHAGAYFVTLCTQDRACLFGEVVGEEMRLNAWGRIVADAWAWLARQYPHVDLDASVVMPNHLHGIIVIRDNDVPIVGAVREPPLQEPPLQEPHTPGPEQVWRKPLGRLIGAFKTVSAKNINTARGTPGAPVWQRNYYEHVIRSEESLNRIRQYILDNPMRWAYDRENSEAITREPEDVWRT